MRLSTFSALRRDREHVLLVLHVKRLPRRMLVMPPGLNIKTPQSAVSIHFKFNLPISTKFSGVYPLPRFSCMYPTLSCIDPTYWAVPVSNRLSPQSTQLYLPKYQLYLSIVSCIQQLSAASSIYQLSAVCTQLLSISVSPTVSFIFVVSAKCSVLSAVTSDLVLGNHRLSTR